MKEIKKFEKFNKHNRQFLVPNEKQYNYTKKIKNEIENKYRLNVSNRNDITKSLIALFTHGDLETYKVDRDLKIIIIRTDIKQFFPSVNKHLLYKKIIGSNILSENTITYIKTFLFSSKVNGIPLGLPFSNSLAEIYLEHFDRDIKLIMRPYAYFRYVDDILLFYYSDSRYNSTHSIEMACEDKLLHKDLESVFNKHNLIMNKEKTETSYFQSTKNKLNDTFSYLGYNYYLDNNELKISISDNKLNKVKNKINRHFYDFENNDKTDKEFWKLYYKIKNLIYGITSYSNNKNKILKFGLGYSYQFLNTDTKLDVLIRILKTNIYTSDLSSRKKYILNSLIKYNKSSLELLTKKYDYTKMSNNQLEKIKNRLELATQSKNLSRIFYEIYS